MDGQWTSLDEHGYGHEYGHEDEDVIHFVRLLESPCVSVAILLLCLTSEIFVKSDAGVIGDG